VHMFCYSTFKIPHMADKCLIQTVHMFCYSTFKIPHMADTSVMIEWLQVT